MALLPSTISGRTRHPHAEFEFHFPSNFDFCSFGPFSKYHHHIFFLLSGLLLTRYSTQTPFISSRISCCRSHLSTLFFQFFCRGPSSRPGVFQGVCPQLYYSPLGQSLCDAHRYSILFWSTLLRSILYCFILLEHSLRAINAQYAIDVTFPASFHLCEYIAGSRMNSTIFFYFVSTPKLINSKWSVSYVPVTHHKYHNSNVRENFCYCFLIRNRQSRNHIGSCFRIYRNERI